MVEESACKRRPDNKLVLNCDDIKMTDYVDKFSIIFLFRDLIKIVMKCSASTKGIFQSVDD